MPTSKSAAKRLRQSQKRAVRNKRVKLNIAYLAKQAAKALAAKDQIKAKEFVVRFQKAVDKAVQHGVLHRHTAARQKSRLMAKVNAIK